MDVGKSTYFLVFPSPKTNLLFVLSASRLSFGLRDTETDRLSSFHRKCISCCCGNFYAFNCCWRKKITNTHTDTTPNNNIFSCVALLINAIFFVSWNFIKKNIFPIFIWGICFFQEVLQGALEGVCGVVKCVYDKNTLQLMAVVVVVVVVAGTLVIYVFMYCCLLKRTINDLLNL